MARMGDGREGGPGGGGGAGRMTRDRAIEAHALTRTFGSFTAVDHITFDVGVGEVFGFLGANGAGKTTAIRMLIGLLAPTSGTARSPATTSHARARRSSATSAT